VCLIGVVVQLIITLSHPDGHFVIIIIIIAMSRQQIPVATTLDDRDPDHLIVVDCLMSDIDP